MVTNPRRIGAVEIVLEMQGTADQLQKEILEKAAMNCPVFLSLHSDMEKRIAFNWK